MSSAQNSTAFPASYLNENRSRGLLDVAIVFGVLEPIFFVLFLISRWLNRTTNGMDFWLMIPAFCFCYLHVPLQAAFVIYAGAGRHYLTVSTDEFTLWLKLIYVETWLYIVSATLPKLAILALYQRIFLLKHKPVYKWIIRILQSMMCLTILADWILSLVTCRPLAYNWDLTIPGGYCGDRMGPYRWISLPNILTDVAILLLPIPMVWNLQTSRPNKVGLTVTFLTASIGLVTSIIRFTTFFGIDLFADPTFNVIETMTWTGAEPGVYFIAACLPSMRVLLRMARDIMHSRTLRGHHRTDSGSDTKGIRLMDQPKVSNETNNIVENSYSGSGIIKATDIEITYHTHEGLENAPSSSTKPF